MAFAGAGPGETMDKEGVATEPCISVPGDKDAVEITFCLDGLTGILDI